MLVTSAEKSVKTINNADPESLSTHANSKKRSGKEKNNLFSHSANTSGGKTNSKFFIKPVKVVLIDLVLYFFINAILIYELLFLIPDMSIAMIGAVWVAIIAWRGGLAAGLFGCILIYLSNLVNIYIPPHDQIPMSYYFNGRVPGVIIGFTQTLICGSVVGYISQLVHQLRNEIQLRKEFQKELEQKIAELNSFGHTVAHDLKNPLMVINVSIESLVKEFANYDSPKAKKMIAFIQSGTIHMRNIIEALLLFAGIRKIDTNEFTNFSVSVCVEDALKRMAFDIEHNHAKIIKPDKWPSVFGYAPWITEVWVNYVNNAIKFGGNPALQITPVLELGYDMPGTFTCNYPDHIRFWVKDNGEGIPEKNCASLFKEFSRLHTSEHEGHGVGLSIVKSVVERLNGTVGVECNEGTGSRFFFTLPAITHEN
jgi:signal transduction histidine kinase